MSERTNGSHSGPLVRALRGPEIVIGLIGAVGTDLPGVQQTITQNLEKAHYRTHSIRLSQLMLDSPRPVTIVPTSPLEEDTRINEMMSLGDRWRTSMKRGDAVVLLAVQKIRQIRSQALGTADDLFARQAYVLNSLKHPDEITTLRTIYGPSFISISVYSPEHIRKHNLANGIAQTRQDYHPERYFESARELICRDAEEVGLPLGQSVRNAFPMADIFIEEKNTEHQVGRAVDLLLGHPFITPTVYESGMYHAKAASYRSSDLSRQVGAVITTNSGDLISSGCNEVPKAGGGAVWDGHPAERDYREFRIRYDSAARHKLEIAEDLFTRLLKAGWLSDAISNQDPQKLASLALYEGESRPLRGSRAANILEFGRIVHAEMHAITEAARRGRATENGVLFCTTFPCHMCARHIISSGIKEVVYIEPYPKSMTKQLYQRSVQVDDDPDCDDDAVKFRPFVGVSPSRYTDLFTMHQRKDDRGYVISWSAADNIPTFNGHPYSEAEKYHISLLPEDPERFLSDPLAGERQ